MKNKVTKEEIILLKVIIYSYIKYLKHNDEK